jgi:glycine/D-amino acid oxidase-like deaminating enzyme
VVVGAGIMGVVAAHELDLRGWRISLVDAGSIPNPLAASTDISKVCRMEYGPDAGYMTLAEEARTGWLSWNGRWRVEGNPALYHETGVVMMSLDDMSPGGFEWESFEQLRLRGHQPERIGGSELVARFPAWSPRFKDGFFHAKGGWAESGRVLAALVAEARQRNIEVVENERVISLDQAHGRVTGVETEDGRHLEADAVVLSGGSWLAESELLPELAGCLTRSYHPVWHLKPSNPELFTADRFPVFTADIARTGFYGFPVHPTEGVVKMGHHGVGVAPRVASKPEPEEPANGALTVPEDKTAKFRSFLAENFPALADSEIVSTRLCPYCDTADEDLWIAPHPKRIGLTVASGGSGHGFKFAPVLGPIIADAVEGRPNKYSERFRWRPEVRMEQGREAARCHDHVW